TVWAGASMLAEAPGILPYEIARRFGNHRIARTVFAFRMDVAGRTAEPWAAFDGEFDVAALAAGLEATGLPFAKKGDQLTIVVSADLEVRVTPTTAEVAPRPATAGAP